MVTCAKCGQVISIGQQMWGGPMVGRMQLPPKCIACGPWQQVEVAQALTKLRQRQGLRVGQLGGCGCDGRRLG